MLQVRTVCVFGMGSSMLLKHSAQKAFAELGIDAHIEHCELTQANNLKVDVVITSPSIAKTLKVLDGTVIITTTNYIDVNVMKEKIKQALIQE